MNEEEPERYWEVDVARGIAVITMILFHFFYDLYYFGDYGVDVYSLKLLILGRFTALTFIFLVGLSLTLSYSKSADLSQKELAFKYIKRGLKIFFYGLIITGVTYLVIPGDHILFGILHFIGVSIILAFPLLRYRKVNLLIALLVVPLGLWVGSMTVETNILLWLGLTSSSFSSVDYFPLLPWFAVVLVGLYLGKELYPEGKRRIDVPELSDKKPIEVMTFLGRNSLKIYLLHQPVILALLYFLGVIEIGFLP